MPYHSIEMDGLPEEKGIYEIRTTFGQKGTCYYNGDQWGKYFTPLNDDRDLKIELDARNQVTHWRCS